GWELPRRTRRAPTGRKLAPRCPSTQVGTPAGPMIRKGVSACAPEGDRRTMYETHFGLKQRPFRPTPDPDSYYPATGHECALARLRQALNEDEGLLLLAGAPGAGKTLLCHRLLETIGGEAACAFLTNS